MQQEGSIALFQYWNRLRDGRAAPARGDIEPADIKTLLADTFILEADSRGEAIFRLAGTRLCAAYGREMKGFAFRSLWPVRDQRMIMRLLSGVFIERSIAVLAYDGISQGGRSVPFEMILLPLESTRDNARCLGLVTAGQRAYWLGSDPVIEAKVESVRVVDPDRDPLFLKNRPAIQIGRHDEVVATGIKPELNSASRPRRVKHLVVHDGGKPPEKANTP